MRPVNSHIKFILLPAIASFCICLPHVFYAHAKETADKELRENCKNAAVRGGDFLLQKRENLPPVWERQGGYMFVATSEAIKALICLYDSTGDERYIKPIKESADFLVGMEEELLKMGFQGKGSAQQEKPVQKKGSYSGWKPGTQRGPPPDYLRGSPEKGESFYQKMSEIMKRLCLGEIGLAYYKLTQRKDFPKDVGNNTGGFKNLDLSDFIKEVDYLGCAKRMGDWFVDHQDYRGVWDTDVPFQAQTAYFLLRLYEITNNKKYIQAVTNVKPRLVEMAEFKIEKCVASASTTGYVGLLTPAGEKGDTLKAARDVADWFVRLQASDGMIGLPNHPGGIIYSDYMNAEWIVKELWKTSFLTKKNKYQDTALKCVKWVLDTQGSDGSWGGEEGGSKCIFKTAQSIRTLCYMASEEKNGKK